MRVLSQFRPEIGNIRVLKYSGHKQRRMAPSKHRRFSVEFVFYRVVILGSVVIYAT